MITLSTLDTATEQEVFDQVYLHLIEQNEQAIDENGDCFFLHLDCLELSSFES